MDYYHIQGAFKIFTIVGVGKHEPLLQGEVRMVHSLSQENEFHFHTGPPGLNLKMRLKGRGLFLQVTSTGHSAANTCR